jgi:hypothetical protein
LKRRWSAASVSGSRPGFMEVIFSSGDQVTSI